MKRQSKKAKLAAALATLLIGLMACEQTPQSNPNSTDKSETTPEKTMPGKGIRVSSSASVSTYGIFAVEIINMGLEKLGYQTEGVKELDIPVAHVSIGNGDIDVYGVHWQKLHEKFFRESGGEEKIERIGVIIADAVQGYQIDKNTADKYKITNLEQLKDPKIAKLFDSDGNGKANLTGCNPGWGCELVIEHHLDTYGLRDTVEHDQGNYDTLLAATIARQRQGKPIFYYVYAPHWSSIVLEVGKDATWLEVPFTSLPKELGEVTAEDTSVEGKNLGFAIDQIRIIANKEFITANPAAKRLFELIKIPIEDVNAQQKLVREGESNPKQIRRHAQQWVENNQELFDSWVEEARNSAIND
ncbi:MAG: glycine betaine/L-proline ABC transporter substrate-binding protein ProX [Crocosphaera sp.]|nr:glycine betaine/L-proline ABC transporter substrate-binding protein ProX [Crocosphaera sp.]